MNNQEKYYAVRLKQANRLEIPFTLLKGFLLLIVVMLAVLYLQSCRPEANKPLTKAEQKANVETLWGRNTEAHNARLP